MTREAENCGEEPRIITNDDYQRTFMIKVTKFKFDREACKDLPVSVEWVKPDLEIKDVRATRKPLVSKKCKVCGAGFKSRKDSQIRCSECQEKRNKILGKMSYERLKNK